MSTIDTSRSYVMQGQTLQEICDAVKTKTGASSVNVSNLAAEIGSISSGGGGSLSTVTVTITMPSEIGGSGINVNYLNSEQQLVTAEIGEGEISTLTVAQNSVFLIVMYPGDYGITPQAAASPSDDEFQYYIYFAVSNMAIELS